MAPLSELDFNQMRSGNHSHQASRDSGQFTNTKGLLNGPGQNNCFLNSAVQVLWHLDIFRRSFRELSGHACMAESCIFCALKELFSQLQFSQESALPPDTLRRALAETFFDQQRFQLGFMDDASECFENILLRIHFHVANEEVEDMCNAKHCIPHQKFAMTLVEQSVCDACGATSEPLPFTQMVHYVSASALTEQARQLAATSPTHSDLFGQLLRRAGGMGDIRDCPSNCGAKIQICRSLMNRPEIISVGIVWDSERPTLEQIMAVFAAVGTTLRPGDVFHSVVDQRWALKSQHALVGVVTYYGKHYSTFFFHTKLRLWIYFDDANVREVGPRWEQVVEKCRRGRYQPLLLLYAALSGTPVITQDAPKFITPVTNLQTSPAKSHKSIWSYNKSPNNGINQVSQLSVPSPPIRRSVTPSPEKPLSTADSSSPTRRAVTPNPEIKREALGDYQNLFDVHAMILTKESDVTAELQKETESNYLNRQVPESILTLQQICRSNGGSIKVQKRLSSNFSQNDMKPRAIGLELYRSNSMSNRMLPTNLELNRSNSMSKNSLERSKSVHRSDSTESEKSGIFNRASSETDSMPGFIGYNRLHSESGRIYSESDSGNYSGLHGNNSSGGESLNVSRRRDSGNWSGDRNSASSSSSTSMENPYLYIVGKMQQRNGVGSRGIIAKKENTSMFDQGYDSYSLSSTDSLPLQQGLKHSLHLAQIPEARVTGVYNKSNSEILPIGQDCEELCQEADDLLEKSKLLEDQLDYEGALVLIRAACAKSRAAMDAPYSNPANITLARMKHNSCIVGLRSLQRKLAGDKEGALEGRYSRENSSGNIKSKGNHSRQGSRDSNKSQHSRQNSREIISNQANPKNSGQTNWDKLPQPVAEVHNLSDKVPQTKNIEIYATLPKKKMGVIARVKSRTTDSPTKNIIEDAEYMIYDRPGRDKSRGRDKNDKPLNLVKEKRARSEERNKKSDFNPLLLSVKDGPKKQIKDFEIKTASKKQHKIRRKLLMGGLIRRKNRSMPDLREEEDLKGNDLKTLDDTSIKSTTMIDKHLSGYLSEGHLEFAGNATNPNLERSRLMRKSFHGSAGKVLHVAKVPPPPPLRTTSQLSKATDEAKNSFSKEEDNSVTNNGNKGGYYGYNIESRSLPYLPIYTADKYSSYKDDLNQYDKSNVCALNESTVLVTRAQVHQEPENFKGNEDLESSCTNLPLPPYPSPLNSVVHSRQTSEEFPPPPDEVLNKEETSLLSQLQNRRQQILAEQNKFDAATQIVETNINQGPENPLLKELQAKLNQKINKTEISEDTVDFVDNAKPKMEDPEKISSVKNLTTKFEHIRKGIDNLQLKEKEDVRKYLKSPVEQYKMEKKKVDDLKTLGVTLVDSVFNSKLNERNDVVSNANFTTSVLKLTGGEEDSKHEGLVRRKSGIKKNVTFCDHVVLVATADEDEEDNFIPNPILERILRSAVNKDPNDKINKFVRSHLGQKTEALNQEKSKLMTKISEEKSKLQPLQKHSLPSPSFNDTVTLYSNRMSAQKFAQLLEAKKNNQNSNSPEILRINSQPEIISSNIIKGHTQEIVYPKAISPQCSTKVEGYHITPPQTSQFDSTLSNAHYFHASESDQGYPPLYALPPEPSRISAHQLSNDNVISQQYSKSCFTSNSRLIPPVSPTDHFKMNNSCQPQHQFCNVPPLRQIYSNPVDISTSQNAFLDPKMPTKDVFNNEIFELGRGTVTQTDKSASVRLALQKTPQMVRTVMNLRQNPIPPFSSPSNPYSKTPNYQVLPKNSPARIAAQSENKSNLPSYYHPLPNKLHQNKTLYPIKESKSWSSQSQCFPYQQTLRNSEKFSGKQPENSLEQHAKTNDMRQSQENLLQIAATKSNLCHLCRKKHVILPSLYCSDCDFYMSRFHPKS